MRTRLHDEPLTACINPAYLTAADGFRVWCDEEDLFNVPPYRVAMIPIMERFFPPLADDNDNVYVWSGRWHLHALDKHGNLRWRMTFCVPERSPKVSIFLNYGDCSPEIAVGPHTFLDYDGKLYFFIGDELYVVSPSGEVFKHRIITPSIMSEYPDRRTFIAAGAAQGSRSLRVGPRSSGASTDGTLVPFFGAEADIFSQRDNRASGILRLTEVVAFEEIPGTLFDEEAGLSGASLSADENQDLIVLSARPQYMDGAKSGEHDGVIGRQFRPDLMISQYKDGVVTKLHERGGSQDVGPIHAADGRSYIVHDDPAILYGFNCGRGVQRASFTSVKVIRISRIKTVP